MKNRLLDILGYAPMVMLAFLFAIVPWPYSVLHQSSIIIFCTLYVIDYVLNKRWIDWTFGKNKYVYVACVAFFLLIIFRHLFEVGSTAHYHSVIEHRLPFLVVGLIGLLGFEKIDIRLIAYTVIGSSLLIIAYIVYLTGWSNLTERSVDSLWLINDVRRINVNSHMVVNYYWNTALIFVFYLLFSSNSRLWERIFVVVSGILIFFMLLLSEGRVGFISACILIAMIVTYRVWLRNKWLSGVVLMCGMVICGVLFASHSRNTIYFLQNEPRIAIWEHTFNLINQHPLTGYGVSDGREVFVSEGLKNDDFVAKYVRIYETTCEKLGLPIDYTDMHPHNAFLEAWLEFGIFGLVVLISILCLALLINDKHRRIYVLMVVAIFFLQAMTETIGTHFPPLIFLYALIVFDYGKERLNRVSMHD